MHNNRSMQQLEKTHDHYPTINNMKGKKFQELTFLHAGMEPCSCVEEAFKKFQAMK